MVGEGGWWEKEEGAANHLKLVPKQDRKPEFQEGERVLCFHGPLLYEAKCVKVAIKDKQVKYWNKNRDEWVPESRVLKYVDTNLQKQQELQKASQEQYAEGKMRGAGPGKETSGLQQKNVEVKTKKNQQKTPGNGDGGSTSETPQPPIRKWPEETRLLKMRKYS